MCGRYYIDDTTEKEVNCILGNIFQNTDTEQKPAGDIFPSQSAFVIKNQNGHLTADRMAWGFPRFDGNGLLINARAESALERRTFRESVLHRRCVIPARGFYEWDSQKEKFSYERKDGRPLFMAGCFNLHREQDCFIILTTEANSSVASVHDRMPLILEPEELESWVLDDRAAEFILHKTPPLLKSSTEYEQIKLF